MYSIKMPYPSFQSRLMMLLHDYFWVPCNFLWVRYQLIRDYANERKFNATQIGNVHRKTSDLMGPLLLGTCCSWDFNIKVTMLRLSRLAIKRFFGCVYKWYDVYGVTIYANWERFHNLPRWEFGIRFKQKQFCETKYPINLEL